MIRFCCIDATRLLSVFVQKQCSVNGASNKVSKLKPTLCNSIKTEQLKLQVLHRPHQWAQCLWNTVHTWRCCCAVVQSSDFATTEPSGGQGPIPVRTLPIERQNKGPQTSLGFVYLLLPCQCSVPKTAISPSPCWSVCGFHTS